MAQMRQQPDAKTDDGASGDNFDGPDLPKLRSHVRTRIGIALILLSGVLWFSMFAVPFFSVTLTQKTMIVGVLFVGVQVSWWIGAALVGPQAVKKLFGWFRQSKDDAGESQARFGGGEGKG